MATTSSAKDKARELLGAGLENSVVASALGVSASLVSQWLSEETFADEVQTLKLVNLTQATERDRKWNTLEDKLLDKLEFLLPTLTNPAVVLQALRTVNGATRRSNPRELEPVANQTHVHLHMPSLLAAKFVVNPANQVVEVDGRSIATMPANAVVKELERRKQLQEIIPHPSQDAIDKARAQERIDNLAKLSFLPVHELV
jgi:arginine/lysine/ornithine decarboxylase